MWYVIDVYMQIWQCSRSQMPLSEVLRAQSRLQVERPDMDPKRTETNIRDVKEPKTYGTVEQCAVELLHVACEQFAWVSCTQVGPIVFLDLKWCGHFFFPANLNWAVEILLRIVFAHSHGAAAYCSLLRCMRTWRCADWKEDTPHWNCWNLLSFLKSFENCFDERVFGVHWEDVAVLRCQNAHPT